MTAYQLFRGLTGVDGELLAAVEPVDSRKEPTTKKLPARKIWLIAAVIALALLLARPVRERLFGLHAQPETA